MGYLLYWKTAAATVEKNEALVFLHICLLDSESSTSGRKLAGSGNGSGSGVLSSLFFLATLGVSIRRNFFVLGESVTVEVFGSDEVRLVASRIFRLSSFMPKPDCLRDLCVGAVIALVLIEMSGSPTFALKFRKAKVR